MAHLSLAELLLEETDGAARSEAREHLDIAIPELREMHMQPALTRAMALSKHVAPTVQAPSRTHASDMLTVREREIASLVSDGLSNREFAERLVISEGTVEVHVKHILGKLDFKSRSQVAAWFGGTRARKDRGHDFSTWRRWLASGEGAGSEAHLRPTAC